MQEIPEKEVENVLSVYWQMLRELESQAHSDKDPYKRMLVAGAYGVLNRISFTTHCPVWEKK
jgi:hypothetical protein